MLRILDVRARYHTNQISSFQGKPGTLVVVWFSSFDAPLKAISYYYYFFSACNASCSFKKLRKRKQSGAICQYFELLYEQNVIRDIQIPLTTLLFMLKTGSRECDPPKLLANKSVTGAMPLRTRVMLSMAHLLVPKTQLTLICTGHCENFSKKKLNTKQNDKEMNYDF